MELCDFFYSDFFEYHDLQSFQLKQRFLSLSFSKKLLGPLCVVELPL